MSSDAVLLSVLKNARQELLDLSARNRLLSTSRGSTRSSRLDIVDELSEAVFRHLVTEKKSMSFLPVPDKDQAESSDSEEQVLLFSLTTKCPSRMASRRGTRTTNSKHC